jgi:hypothetical protein
MSDLSKATRRPWRRDGRIVWKSGDGNANVCAVGEPHKGDFVGYMELAIGSPDADEAFANAALIVMAVNLHDDLIVALRSTLSLLKCFTSETDDIARAAWQQAEAALSKADAP